MRYTTDMSPLFRSTIGFDRLFDLLQEHAGFDQAENYPPYNIAKTGEDAYRITMAVAGFTPEEIDVTAQQNVLTVSGRKQENEGVQYLHRGLAARAFQRRFDLADHVKVTGAALENGLLMIELVREVPEAMKPRRIAVNGAGQPKVIESSSNENNENQKLAA